MGTAATEVTVGSTTGSILHPAFELGRKKWTLGFTNGLGQKTRKKNVVGGDRSAVLREIAAAKRRFGLPEDARVVSCYEAGPEGFWLHRWLESIGVENVVVDSASIEVDRRRRRAKSDGLDVEGLVKLLCRHTMGERRVWSVVRVPPPQIEDIRQLHRDLAALTEERTRIRNRIRGLLATHGATIRGWTKVREQLQRVRLWDRSALGQGLLQRLAREKNLVHGDDHRHTDTNKRRRTAPSWVPAFACRTVPLRYHRGARLAALCVLTRPPGDRRLLEVDRDTPAAPPEQLCASWRIASASAGRSPPRRGQFLRGRTQPPLARSVSSRTTASAQPPTFQIAPHEERNHQEETTEQLIQDRITEHLHKEPCHLTAAIIKGRSEK